MGRAETGPAERGPARPQPLIGTNVKMTLTPSEATAYLATLRDLTADVEDRTLFVMPPFPAIQAAATALAGSHIAWGAQDVHPDDRGAHTGDVSAPMLADLGCTYVLVGHFERRRDHGETDELVARKARAVQRWGMIPVVWLGEMARGRSGEASFPEVAAQLRALDGVDLERSVLAYEPGWAIGAGSRPASPGWTREMVARIRTILAERCPDPDRVPVITGGSIDLQTAPALFRQPGVNGLFVGRNALDPVAFSRIIRAVSPTGGSPDRPARTP